MAVLVSLLHTYTRTCTHKSQRPTREDRVIDYWYTQGRSHCLLLWVISSATLQACRGIYSQPGQVHNAHISTSVHGERKVGWIGVPRCWTRQRCSLLAGVSSTVTVQTVLWGDKHEWCAQCRLWYFCYNNTYFILIRLTLVEKQDW